MSAPRLVPRPAPVFALGLVLGLALPVLHASPRSGLLVVSSVQQTADAETTRAARLALEDGDYAAALGLAAELADVREREALRSEFLALAREWEGATDAVERGLAVAPRDPLLLWRGAFVRLWAQDAAGALRYVEGLEAALDAAEARGDSLDTASWRASAASFRADAEARLAHASERDRAVSRSRTVVWGFGLGLSVLAAALLRTGR